MRTHSISSCDDIKGRISTFLYERQQDPRIGFLQLASSRQDVALFMSLPALSCCMCVPMFPKPNLSDNIWPFPFCTSLFLTSSCSYIYKASTGQLDNYMCIRSVYFSQGARFSCVTDADERWRLHCRYVCSRCLFPAGS